MAISNGTMMETTNEHWVAATTDHPARMNKIRPIKRNRAKVSFTSQVLESILFQGHRIISAQYDPNREIISFQIDMGTDDRFEVTEGREPTELDWTALDYI